MLSSCHSPGQRFCSSRGCQTRYTPGRRFCPSLATSSQPKGIPPSADTAYTVISNAASRRFFFHVCSCKRVGLRREKSLFVLPFTLPPRSTSVRVLAQSSAHGAPCCLRRGLRSAPPIHLVLPLYFRLSTEKRDSVYTGKRDHPKLLSAHSRISPARLGVGSLVVSLACKMH